MKVDKHINELLYAHDCIIVPQLGGFVANYAPAKIHPVQQTFSPPSKNIVFNKNLVNNDGLLANHIANAEQTDYSQALQYINNFVDVTHSRLKQGIKVKLDEIGTLYLDAERNIQFEPGTTNYLLDAFGLTQFQSPAIKRDTIGRKRIEKELKDRDIIPAGKKKTHLKYYVALAIALPLIFGMVWIPLKTDFLKNMNYSNLNPFSSGEAVKYKTPEHSNTKLLEEKDYKTTPLLNESDTSKYVHSNLAEHSSQLLTGNMPATAEAIVPDTTKVVINTSAADEGRKYHLVTGCFQVYDNAINYVESLQAQNMNALIIGRNREGLYVVSCGDYTSRREASNQLQQLRKIKPDAWLYKN